MFDLSIAEIGVIGVVALLVLGPERLPKAARTLGFYVRKARQSWFAVRSEFERELAAEELKRTLKLDEVHATLKETARELRDEIGQAQGGLTSAAEQAQAELRRVGGADPLPASALESDPPTPAAGDEDDGGLTPEERARQSEPALEAPEPEPEPERELEAHDTRSSGPELGQSAEMPRAATDHGPSSGALSTDSRPSP